MAHPSDYEKERARIKGEEDAKRDRGAGFLDLITLGMFSNSTYDPPRDPVLKAHYDAGWEKVKKNK